MKVENVIDWFITEGMDQAAQDLKEKCIEVEFMSHDNMQRFFESIYGTEEESNYMFDSMLGDIEVLDFDSYEDL